tara:strand:- start:32 stop:694 length:663 start_codon:yes stop_codon:yes gene_type:complete
MNKIEKNLLFYSNHCDHSKKLLNFLNQSIINNNIIYICIDDKHINLPHFIKRVPTIYLTQEKRIIIEQEIDYWVNQQISIAHNKMERMKKESIITQQQQNPNMMPPSNQNPNMMPPSNQNPNMMPPSKLEEKKEEVSSEIMAYHDSEMGSQLSNNYSFISDDNNSLNNNFTFLNTNSDMAINTPKEDSNKTTKGSALDGDYERLMNDRNGASWAKPVQRL